MKIVHDNTLRHGCGARGPSSFHMQDPELVFKGLNLSEGETFLDLGCGAGDYALRASKEVGCSGAVFALDRLSGIIENLESRAREARIENLTGIVCDITGPLPLDEESVDAVLVATVLHTLDFSSRGIPLFREIRRVAKKGGRLITIDCKKEESSFGPPMHMRLSPEEINGAAGQCGFRIKSVADLGFNYMLIFDAG
jgi:ubiquinone/menaquinone biosynthesis C-methylase UbiE